MAYLSDKEGDIQNNVDGAEVVVIHAGEFVRGTGDDEIAQWIETHPDRRAVFLHEQPARSIDLEAYGIYKYPVTVGQFRRFAEATGYRYDWERWKPRWGWIDEHPMVRVTWRDAAEYAAWAGGALPTEAQWEKAARGGDRRFFPWGNEWPPPAGAGNFADLAVRRKNPTARIIEGYHDGYAYTSPVGMFAANPYGVHDLAGNVSEWCADWYGAEYYRQAPALNPPGPDETQATIIASGDLRFTARVVRGGAWNDYTPRIFRAASRRYYFDHPLFNSSEIGFRCILAVATLSGG